MDTLEARFANKIEERPSGVLEISDRVAPSASERAAIQERRAQLAASLKPADDIRIEAMMTGLKILMPSQATDAHSVDAEARMTVATLRRFPEWAIAAAFRKFAEGQIPRKTTFCPTTAEIVPACEAELREVRAEIGRLDRILSAKVYHEPTEEERAAARERIDACLKKFKSASDPDRERRAAERSHRAEEAKAGAFGSPISGLQLSDEALAKVRGEAA